MIRFAVFLLPLTLCGCLAAEQNVNSGMTPQQQAYYDYAISEGMDKNKATLFAVSPIAQQLFFDDKKCKSYGSVAGSDAYVACRAQLEAAHR